MTSPIRPSLALSRTCRALAAAALLVLGGCAATGPAPSAGGSSSARELAKLDLTARLSDDAHWENALGVPRSHPRFAVLRDTLRAQYLSREVLEFYATSEEVRHKFPNTTTAGLIGYMLVMGITRFSDQDAEGYLQSRAQLLDRLDAKQCAAYMDGKLPNREAWALALVANDDEIRNFYSFNQKSLTQELRRTPTRPLPATGDISAVATRMKASQQVAGSRDSGDARCKGAATWLRSHQSFDGAQRSTALTLMLAVIASPPKDAGKDPARKDEQPRKAADNNRSI
jgi:hypothetical protein